jgi:hypothetical protein
MELKDGWLRAENGWLDVFTVKKGLGWVAIG